MSPAMNSTFLDPLVFDLPTSARPAAGDHSKLLEELELWTNAQFTFDVQPGAVVHDKPTTLPIQSEHDLWTFLALDSPSSAASPSPSMQSSSYTLPSPPARTANTTSHPRILPKSTPQKRSRTEEEKAIEDDKRRRNTAASARFRAKKKLKDQALEQAVKDITEKSDKLEERVHDLEKEIKWLRSLLIDKDTSSPPASALSPLA